MNGLMGTWPGNFDTPRTSATAPARSRCLKAASAASIGFSGVQYALARGRPRAEQEAVGAALARRELSSSRRARAAPTASCSARGRPRASAYCTPEKPIEAADAAFKQRLLAGAVAEVRGVSKLPGHVPIRPFIFHGRQGDDNAQRCYNAPARSGRVKSAHGESVIEHITRQWRQERPDLDLGDFLLAIY